jgi:hypothetical protein
MKHRQAAREALVNSFQAGPGGADSYQQIADQENAIADKLEGTLGGQRQAPYDEVETYGPIDTNSNKPTWTRKSKVPQGAPMPGQTQWQPSAAIAAPADPKQRKAGQAYTTPKGTYTWTGTGWSQ